MRIFQYAVVVASAVTSAPAFAQHLANHLADVAGTGNRRADISTTFLQPFVSRAFADGRTLTFNVESTYDWK